MSTDMQHLQPEKLISNNLKLLVSNWKICAPSMLSLSVKGRDLVLLVNTGN